MTDETTPDETAPEVAASAADTSAEDTAPVAAGSGADAAQATPRKGIFVPRWLAILLGLVIAVGLVGGGGFALGRSTADDDHHERVEDQREGPAALPPLGNPGPRGGNGGGNGNGNGGGSGDSTPTRPSPTSGVYLGVAVAGSSSTQGARVVEVVAGSPADDAGLKVGDVITAVDGTDVTDGAALAAAIQGYRAGDKVKITYDRDGTSATATAELADRSQSAPPTTSPPA
jgi:membrane-associated protease RseP (regulator of RpoE activity)